MSRSQRKDHSTSGNLTFAVAAKSFVGFLEGTEKSIHTIKNYQSDLETFREFLESGLGSKPVPLSRLTRTDLNKFQEHLKLTGLKTNSRRRKILTVRRLLRYLTQRKKLTLDVSNKLPAPAKVERVPVTLSSSDLIKAVRTLRGDSAIRLRNRVLLWTLAETGCQVSEVTRLRFDQFKAGATGAYIHVGGKQPRQLPISLELAQAAIELREASGDHEHAFPGFNRHGTSGAPISSRGVELLVRAHAVELGFPDLTPRTFRHSAVVTWFGEGVTRDAIQHRLGLRTAYAFRVYEPLFKKITADAESTPTSSTP